MFQASHLNCLIFIFWITLLASCSQPAPIDSSLLSGKWKLLEATRSGQKSRSLEGAYLNFLKDSVQSNILGDTALYSYQLDQRTINQKSNPEIKYLIEDINQDSLVLTSTIMEIDFTFLFLKTKE